MRLPHWRQFFNAARRTWHGWSEAKAKRSLPQNEPTPRGRFAAPALLLFPRQIVRKAEEIRDAAVFGGLMGGMMPHYGGTGGHHISTYQAAPSADLWDKGPCPSESAARGRDALPGFVLRQRARHAFRQGVGVEPCLGGGGIAAHPYAHGAAIHFVAAILIADARYFAECGGGVLAK